MTRFKRFGSGARISEMEPLQFELGGEVFDCKPALQGYELIMFIAESTGEEGGAESIVSLFKRVMNEDEHKRFEKLITGDEVIIAVSDLSEVAAWLVEQYTQRPTQQQSL